MSKEEFDGCLERDVDASVWCDLRRNLVMAISSYRES